MSDNITHLDKPTETPQADIGSAGFTLIALMVGVFAVALATMNPVHKPREGSAAGPDAVAAPSKGFVSFTSEQLPFRADMYDLAAFGDHQEPAR